MSVAVAQYAGLSRRAIANTFRQPRYFIPSLLFPLMFMALSSAAFERTTSLPGFPATDSFLQFLVSTTPRSRSKGSSSTCQASTTSSSKPPDGASRGPPKS